MYIMYLLGEDFKLHNGLLHPPQEDPDIQRGPFCSQLCFEWQIECSSLLLYQYLKSDTIVVGEGYVTTTICSIFYGKIILSRMTEVTISLL